MKVVDESVDVCPGEVRILGGVKVPRGGCEVRGGGGKDVQGKVGMPGKERASRGKVSGREGTVSVGGYLGGS